VSVLKYRNRTSTIGRRGSRGQFGGGGGQSARKVFQDISKGSSTVDNLNGSEKKGPGAAKRGKPGTPRGFPRGKSFPRTPGQKGSVQPIFTEGTWEIPHSREKAPRGNHLL